MKKLLMVSLAFGVAVPGIASGENWVGYEGYLHQSASSIEVGGNVEVVWQKRFTDFVRAWHSGSGWTPEGSMHSRNLAFLYGIIAVAAVPHSTALENIACITVLDAADGSVLNSVRVTSTRKGAYKHMLDATEVAFGEQVLAWDPDTGILFIATGGDMPGHAAILPMANAASYTPGTLATAVGAYAQMAADHPDLRSSRNERRDEGRNVRDRNNMPLLDDEWDGLGGDCNRTAFFDVQPGSQFMATNMCPGHTSAFSSGIGNKHTGLSARKNWAQNVTSDNGWPVWKMWHGLLVAANRIYHIGPYENGVAAADLVQSSRGLRISSVSYVNENLYADDGYYGPGAAETANPTIEWHQTFESTGGANESWHQSGAYNEGYQRNKAWMVQGDGVWVAWKPSQASNVSLVRATGAGAGGATSYDLGVGAGMRYQDIWPNIAWADLGASGRYVVYYAANAYTGTTGSATGTPNGPTTITVFDADAGSVRWTYQLNNAASTGNYPGLRPNPARYWYESSRMVVAGKYAHIAWVDTRGPGDCVLNVLALDITAASAPSSPPAPFTLDLGIAAATHSRTRVIDMMAVNGVLYLLLTESNNTDAVTSTTGQIVGQRVVAIGASGLSTIDVDLAASPTSGPARVAAVFDGSGSTTTAPGGIVSYEWDFDWDHISFNADATGPVVSRVFDTVGTHSVGLRVTDSTGRWEIRAATITVTPDEAAEQSAIFSATSHQGYHPSGVRRRTSGGYGTLGSASHHRGYVQVESVSLASGLDLVGARLWFNVTRVNNNNRKSTVHRLKPTESAPTDWTSIAALIGYDQNPATTTVCEPLDVKMIVSAEQNGPAGAVFFDVTDAVAAWLGRPPYGSPEAQRGFLLTVDDHATSGTLDGGTGPFYSGETAHHSWDWDSTYLEVIYMDPAAETPVAISGVRPGATPSETYDSASALEVRWGSTGPADQVDIHYSTASSTGPWTSVVTGVPNNGLYSWASPVTGGTIWIRVSAAGTPAMNAVSANSFEVASAGPTYTLSGAVTLSGDLTDAAGVTLRLMSGATVVRTADLATGGSYSFTGISAGTYTYELVRANYSFNITTPASASVTVSASTTQNVAAIATQSTGLASKGGCSFGSAVANAELMWTMAAILGAVLLAWKKTRPV